jgi:trimeric autotransporter adhesin
MSSRTFALQFLLTASLLGASLAAPNMAEAAPLVVNANQGTLSTVSAVDFIDINAQIAGDLNILFDIPGAGPISPTALDISNPAGEITGNVNIAAGVTVSASQTGILVSNGGQIGGTITNNGKINVRNSNPLVDVTGIYATSATQFDFRNAGTFSAVDSSAADGKATGIYVVGASTTAGGALRIDNTGSLRIRAHDNSGNAAAAEVIGITLDGTYLGNATASISNSDDLFIDAQAFGVTNVDATVDTGIHMGVSATGAGSAAVASLTNTADLRINAYVQAYTVGTLHADASARIETGISQAATSLSGAATASITNSNDLRIYASAFASAFGGGAEAYASVANGISQSANGVDANVSLNNSAGNIDIIAFAYAKALGTGDATATAFMSTAIYQSAQGGNTAVASLTNAGNLTIKAVATATALGDYAKAFVSMDSQLISQNAYADVNAGSHSNASVSIVNTGDIYMAAEANAYGKTADATASYFYTAIYQNAEGGNTVSALISNSNDLTIKANAYARGTNVEANAVFTSYVIYQTANASSNGASAAADITNSSNLRISANASAFGDPTAKTANAVASFSSSTVLYQSANDGSNTAARITNSGDMRISAYALAEAKDAAGFATATAYFNDVIIYQYANAGNAETSALAEINNTASFNLYATATARGGDFASANATMDGTAIQQTAKEGATSVARIVNSDDMQIFASASATADTADGVAKATASASMAGAIYQSASGGGSGLSATAEIVNSGELNIGVYAKASGVIADAYATFGSTIISQNATSASTVLASIRNSSTGSLDIVANAVARGKDAFAQASASYGIFQSATAGNDQLSATAELTNAGNFYMAVKADAGGYGVTVIDATVATAKALFSSTVLFQTANSASNVVSRLINSGDFNIEALATARAFDGDAKASASFASNIISQNAYASADELTALVSLENSGQFSLFAKAVATGSVISGNASASATIDSAGISQNVGAADISRAVINNSGDFQIIAQAKAYGGGDVEASASIGTGIYQSATANGGNTASVELVNSAGYIDIRAQAYAGSDTFYASSASADAKIDTGIYQSASDAINNLASINNSAADIQINAQAVAYGDTANAQASITSYGVYQSAYGGTLLGSVANVNITNAGQLRIAASASAYATGSKATATATVNTGIYQSAYKASTNIASLTNSGELKIVAFAKADNTSSAANANATIGIGIYQQATSSVGNSSAIASLTNSGDLGIYATAIANASTSGKANASINTGIYQTANTGGSATVVLTNTGDLNIQARAAATGSALASATAFVGSGISQQAYNADETVASLVNSAGTMRISADATATANSGTANADAQVGTGIYQYATGGADISISLKNSADLFIRANAKAYGSTANANATVGGTAASGAGIYQIASGGTTMLALLENTGTLDLNAFALAIGEDNANAEALVNQGIWQSVSGNTASVVDANAVANLTNSGTIRVNAIALAGGDATSSSGGDIQITDFASTSAAATATAGGIRQTVTGGIARLTNTGDINVYAYAEAIASGAAGAQAYAGGVFAEGSSNAALELDYNNQGNIIVTAGAKIDSFLGTASAQATGVRVNSAKVSGILTNSGDILVAAYAEGSFGNATAVGVNLRADDLTASLVNSGTIIAFASHTGSPGNALATAILVGTHGGAPGLGGGTITNDGGTLIAINNPDGMATLGNAINVQDAPHAMTINLKGTSADGVILGGINLSADDTINVTSGNTFLTGAINPDSVSEGTLNINTNGALWLKHNDDFGELVSSMANLNVAADGTLAIGVDADGDSSSVLAGNASLDGTLLIDTNAGIYGNTTLHYEDVLRTSSPATGDFANVIGNSPLFTVSYTVNADGLDDYDIDITRVAFNAAPGLTENESAVAGMLEGLYDPANGGINQPSSAAVDGLESIMAELFSLNAAEYQTALDDLSGAEHAVAGQQYMRSFGMLNGIVGDTLRNRTVVNQAGLKPGESAEGPYINPTADTVAIIDPAKGGFWTRAQGSFSEGEKGNSPGFDGKQGALYFGADANFDGNTVLGVLAGYVTGKYDFADGDDAKYDGYQIGAYAQHNWDATYLRALAVYGSADVSVDRSGTIGLLSGASSADYDANAWHVSGEVGHNWQIDGGATLSPFLGLAYSSYNSSNFVESGTPGSALAADVDGDSLLGSVGLRVSAAVDSQYGKLRPEFSLAWEHEFMDFTNMNAGISGVSGSNFAVTGGDYTRDVAVIGAALGVDVTDTLSMKFSYTGRIGSDYQDHTMFGQLRMEF